MVAAATPQGALLAKLAGVRQAFREVAAVVEGVGALRSLGGEDALIEMAMFAQSHEPTLERAWQALAECEDAARRLPGATLAPSVPPLSLGVLSLGPSVAPAESAPAESAPAESAPPESAPPDSVPPSEADTALATDPAPLPSVDIAADPGARSNERALAESPPPATGEPAVAAAEEEGPVTQVDGPPCRVLVVDDDPAVLRAFRRVLQADHEIVTARDGSEALQIVLSGARVDAIICDIGMPKLDGPAFFSELFELRPQLMPRVVFCTGGQPNDKTQRFLERLQAPLLYKPVAAADLQRAIDVARAR